MSAQETIPGHELSTSRFALSMTWNACKEIFGGPSFSALLFPFEFSRTEASQPFGIRGKNQFKLSVNEYSYM